MKRKIKFFSLNSKLNRGLLLISVALFSTGCSTYMIDMWEGTKTALRLFNQQALALFGDETESRAIHSKAEFFGEGEVDFIPLNDHDIRAQTIDTPMPQSKEVPGLPGGKLPGIEAFIDPSTVHAAIFKKIYFDTDQQTPKTKEDLQVIHRIGQYLKKHPSTYIFIEGHCDQRASEAYNLSLGIKRSNYIRYLLIKEGVHPDQLFTISFGKEKLADLRNDPKGWAVNRRASYKIYEKRVTL